MTDVVWKGNEVFERFLMPLEEVEFNPANTRHHEPKVDVVETAASLRDHGQQRLCVVNQEGVLLAGEGRYLGAKENGWTHLACIKSDITDKDEQELFMIRDNRTAELSGWELDVLKTELRRLNEEEINLYDTQLWAGFELDGFLKDDWKPPETDLKYPSGTGGGGDSGDTGQTKTTGPPMADAVRLTKLERTFVDAAIRLLREREEDDSIQEGRCVELICADFLSGHGEAGG